MAWLIELQNTANLNDKAWDDLGGLIDRARAALEQPVKQPSLMEIVELADELEGEGNVALVRAALAKWGNR